ncbi:MAG: DUF1571 domain-containing protein, partial [Planctomycetes bacterium]|nr:DUF1571 domain-containing protein [Planctomycetota bacterium]
MRRPFLLPRRERLAASAQASAMPVSPTASPAVPPPPEPLPAAYYGPQNSVQRGQAPSADTPGTPEAPSSQAGPSLSDSSPAPLPGTAPAAPENPTAQLRALYRRAADQYAGVNDYLARLHRREEVNGKSQPEELLLFKFRKQPWSVYFKWIGPEGHGREVTYVKGQYGGQIHTLLAAGDNPFLGAGKQMAVSPDNIFIRTRTRHTINEAGIGAIIDKYGEVVAAVEKGSPSAGEVHYLGRQKRPEYDAPMEGVERLIPPGQEPQLPRGGRRYLFFDAVNGLPVLTITQDDRGHEVEYYCYDLFQFNVGLDDNDF